MLTLFLHFTGLNAEERKNNSNLHDTTSQVNPINMCLASTRFCLPCDFAYWLLYPLKDCMKSPTMRCKPEITL